VSVPTNLSAYDHFAKTPFAHDYPENERSFFAPIDDVHGVLVAALGAAEQSLILAMYGFDDEELAAIVSEKLKNPAISVQITLDSSQAGGVHEREILAKQDYPRSVIAIGRSERGAIMHQKIAVVDGILVVSGSTNWSDGGEAKQDNECHVRLDRAVASRYRDRCDAIHAHMVQSTAAKHLAPILEFPKKDS